MKIMNSIFPFIDIIILGLLAVFLGFRLKNLLGDKSGYKENITNEKNTRGTSLENKKVVSEGKGIPWFGWISGQKYKEGI